MKKNDFLKELGLPVETPNMSQREKERKREKLYCKKVKFVYDPMVNGTVDMEMVYKNVYYSLDNAIFFSLDGEYYDYLVSLLAWLEKNSKKLNGEVLDFGCGNAIPACFMALLRPDVRFVGVDINPDAVKVAKQLATKLNVSNIQFYTNEELEHLDQKFDFVCCFRTFHENLPKNCYHQNQVPISLAHEISYDISPFISTLCKYINDTGVFVSVQNAIKPGVRLGYTFAFANKGYYLDSENYFKIKLEKRGETLAGGFYCKNNDKLSESQIIDSFIKAENLSYQSNMAKYIYDNADTYLLDNMGKLVFGFEVWGMSDNGERNYLSLRRSVWVDNADPTSILLHFNDDDNNFLLYRYDVSEISTIQKLFDETKANAIKEGFGFFRIIYENGCENLVREA